MNVEIVKFDNKGRGIGYINNKIIFIPKSIPGDIVDVEIVMEKKNYCEGRIIDIVNPSKFRLKPNCPYFNVCGGCDLMHISLSEALEYKLTKVNDILKQNKIDIKVSDIIKSEPYNYRDKVSLKVVNKKIGYYKCDTHELVEIDYCHISKDAINNIINDLYLLEIQNGEIIIRTNYNDEILLNVITENEIKNINRLVEKHKIVGVIKNDECIYGENYFIDKINDYLFKVSYNSFFQVNPYICSKLFNLIEENTKTSTNVLDLYCGVGTLSIVASKNANKVVGVEIVENAIIDANLNKKINNKSNLEFICADTKQVLNEITHEYDTLILDPPRSGVVNSVIEKINKILPKTIIYVSCDPNTLARDLQLLESTYEIKSIQLLDMFPQTEHVETFVVLKSK